MAGLRPWGLRRWGSADADTLGSMKRVSLSDDAYAALAILKNKGESFSDVVLRLIGAQIPLTSFAGAWSGAPPDQIRRLRCFLGDLDRRSMAKSRRRGRR